MWIFLRSTFYEINSFVVLSPQSAPSLAHWTESSTCTDKALKKKEGKKTLFSMK